MLCPGAERRTGERDLWMDRELRTTSEGHFATGFLTCGEASIRNRGSELQDDELITSVTLFAISCIFVAASFAVCCTIAFVSFPSGSIDDHEGISRKA